MLLPIADTATVRSTALRLVKEHRTALVVVVVLHTFAALFGLVGPWLIGRIIDAMTNGNATGTTVDIMALVLIAAVVCQGLVTRFAQWQAMVLGETVFAALREEFMRIVGHLPLSTVESAGTGDLLARTTNDIESVQATVRFGVPRILVASVTVILTVVAAFVTGPAIAPALFIGVPLLVVTTRWYLRRSGPGYQRQLASYARLAGAISETVEGARTIDALNLAAVQRSKIDKALLERRDAERYTLGLRTVWFPSTDMAFLIPVVAVVAWGAFLTTTGVTSIGAVTTIALYAMQLSSPVGELIRWMDEIQVGTTALSRIIGVGDVPPDREASDRGARRRAAHRRRRPLRVPVGSRGAARNHARARRG